MQARRIKIEKSFVSSLKKVPQQVRQKVDDCLKHFIDRDAEHSLRPEPKSGFKNVWTIRLTRGYRAFYSQETDEQGTYSSFFFVGDHDSYHRF